MDYQISFVEYPYKENLRGNECIEQWQKDYLRK